MLPEQRAIELNTKRGFPWSLLLRWLLGIYIISTCIFGVFALASNWEQFQNIRIIYPQINIYPMFIAWGVKLACGVLMFFRSKWLLVLVPTWMVILMADALSNNKFSQLPRDFFLAVAIQACIFSFVIWMHGRGRLK